MPFFLLILIAAFVNIFITAKYSSNDVFSDGIYQVVIHFCEVKTNWQCFQEWLVKKRRKKKKFR